MQAKEEPITDVSNSEQPIEKDKSATKIPKFLAIKTLFKKYKPEEVIGSGAFGIVCRCTERGRPEREVAVKLIYPTMPPERLANEIKHLRRFGGLSRNVVSLEEVFVEENKVALVFPFIRSANFGRLLLSNLFTKELAKIYFFQLLKALASLHKFGLIHRDIKPGNFLCDFRTQRFALIDFGLSMFEYELEDSTSTFTANFSSKSRRSIPHVDRSGTRGFRAPEILARVNRQTTALDLWSVGVILLCVVVKRFPLFHAREDLESLIELAWIVGIKKLNEGLGRMSRKVEFVDKDVGKHNLRQIIEKLGVPGAPIFDLDRDKHLYELLTGLLEIDPARRLTAEAAMNHPFFEELNK